MFYILLSKRVAMLHSYHIKVVDIKGKVNMMNVTNVKDDFGFLSCTFLQTLK
jgi:hypothetical protein